MKIPADLQPEQVTAIIDTREQTPVDVSPLNSIVDTLDTGDYSGVGLTKILAIERKSGEDMLACIGRERERFDREIQRLLAYRHRAIVVEAGWGFFERGEWRGQIKPAQAIGSLLGWIMAGVPIVMAGDHTRAGQYISRMIFTVARREWRTLKAMHTELTKGNGDANN